MPCDMKHALPLLEYSRAEDVWTMTVIMKDVTKHYHFTIGQPVDMMSMDGKPVKVSYILSVRFLEKSSITVPEWTHFSLIWQKFMIESTHYIVWRNVFARQKKKQPTLGCISYH